MVPEQSKREDSVWYDRHNTRNDAAWYDRSLKSSDDDMRALSSPFILRRIHYTVPYHNVEPMVYTSNSTTRDSNTLRDAVRGNDLNKEPSTGESVIGIVLFLVFIGISGAIGFYIGKLQESRNYVRVPAIN